MMKPAKPSRPIALQRQSAARSRRVAQLLAVPHPARPACRAPGRLAAMRSSSSASAGAHGVTARCARTCGRAVARPLESVTCTLRRAPLCLPMAPRWPPRREDPVLVLTRRANQSIMIGHDIVVTVLEVRGDQVRLGIKAPRSIDVHREEVFANVAAGQPGRGASNRATSAAARSLTRSPDAASATRRSRRRSLSASPTVAQLGALRQPSASATAAFTTQPLTRVEPAASAGSARAASAAPRVASSTA